MKSFCIAALVAIATASTTSARSAAQTRAGFPSDPFFLNSVSTSNYLVTSHFSLESVTALDGTSADAIEYFEAYSDVTKPLCWSSDDEKTKARQYCLATQLVAGHYLAAAMSQWYGPSDEYNQEHVPTTMKKNDAQVPNPFMFTYDKSVAAYTSSSLMRDSRRELLSKASDALKNHICNSESARASLGTRNVGTRGSVRRGPLDASQCAAIVDGSRAQLEARNVANFERGCMTSDSGVPEFAPYMCPLSTIGSSLIRCGHTASNSYHGCSPRCSLESSSQSVSKWNGFAKTVGGHIAQLNRNPSVSLDEYKTIVARSRERIASLVSEAMDVNANIGAINEKRAELAKTASKITIIETSVAREGDPTGKGLAYECTLNDMGEGEFPGVLDDRELISSQDLWDQFVLDDMTSGSRVYPYTIQTAMTMKLRCTKTVSQDVQATASFSDIRVPDTDLNSIDVSGSDIMPPPHPDEHRIVIDAVYFPEVGNSNCNKLTQGPVTVEMDVTMNGDEPIRIARTTPLEAMGEIAGMVRARLDKFDREWEAYTTRVRSWVKSVSGQISEVLPIYAAVRSAIARTSGEIEEANNQIAAARDDLTDGISAIASKLDELKDIPEAGGIPFLAFAETPEPSNVCGVPDIRSLDVCSASFSRRRLLR